MLLAMLTEDGLDIDHSVTGLLSQSSSWKVRKGNYAGTPVCIRSLRATSTRQQLSLETMRAIEDLIFPFAHPNLDTPLGMVEQDSSRHDNIKPRVVDHIVTQLFATNLFDILHVERMKLSRFDIAFISIQVLRALAFLHQNNQSLGVVLTSRRVMLDPAGIVKIRRFGGELVAHCAGMPSIHVNSSFTTFYNIISASKRGGASANPEHLSNVMRDLFAFGVLLLEMCTGDKPSNELVNKLSQARQLDPVFYAIIRATFVLAGIDHIGPAHELNSDQNSEQWVWDNHSGKVTAEMLLVALAEKFCFDSTASTGILDDECSSVLLPSFLHADRKFSLREHMQVEQALRERSSHAEIMVKRLEAVEQELVDEQKNFEVLVQQFEHLQREKQAVELERENSEVLISYLRSESNHNKELFAALSMQSEELLVRHSLLNEKFVEVHTDAKKLEVEKLRLVNENQQLLMEILQLKDEKSRVLELNKSATRECEELRKKIGSERDVLKDLEGRLLQAVRRCQDEQNARQKAELQAETSCKLLLQLEDERCRYSHELWQSPTGLSEARETPAVVITLKEREVASLKCQLQEAYTFQADLKSRISVLANENQAKIDETSALCCEKEALEQEKRDLEARQALLEVEKDTLRKETEFTRAEISTLKQRIVKLEEERKQQEAEEQAAELARKQRRCMTPDCDAPKYLVGSSGYCSECEERMRRTPARSKQGHRRQRSVDGAPSEFRPHALIVKSPKNKPLVKIVNELESPPRGEEYSSMTEVEAAERDMRQRLDGLKKLIELLKVNDAIKDDLPECHVIRTVLALMHAYSTSATFQFEACRFLSMSVFSHDRNRVIVAAEGAIELVLSTMKKFGSEIKLQETCCVALTNLAHNCETNRQRILSSGGVDTVLHLMQSQPKSAGVQKRCCWALLTLAGSDSMCEGVASRGGVGAVIAAMLNCPASEDVQFYGSWALLNLVAGTFTLQQFARREGVVEVAEAARACFPGHDGIQEKTYDLLELLR